jgi:hypothetical protein
VNEPAPNGPPRPIVMYGSGLHAVGISLRMLPRALRAAWRVFATVMRWPSDVQVVVPMIVTTGLDEALLCRMGTIGAVRNRCAVRIERRTEFTIAGPPPTSVHGYRRPRGRSAACQPEVVDAQVDGAALRNCAIPQVDAPSALDGEGSR